MNLESLWCLLEFDIFATRRMVSERGKALKILVIGSGAREHAIVRKLALDAKNAQPAHALELYAAPGNPGIEQYATCVNIEATDIVRLLDFAEEEQIELAVVGPEAPLAEGIVDRFLERNLRVFGPTRNAAKLEASKAFTRELAQQAGIPSPYFEIFTDLTLARDYVRGLAGPIVVKADGLAAGKGVAIAQTSEEAEQVLHALMEEHTFAGAGDTVVIEQFLVGREVSAMAFVDESGYVLMPLIEDHKQLYAGDQGPNTGGMGTYSPVPFVSEEALSRIRTDVFDRILTQCRHAGIPFRGVLFAGLMMVDERPYLIEFNVRFGDPETQVALELLETDLLTIFEAVIDNRIAEVDVRFAKDAALCVVLTAEGYPESPRKGDLITGVAPTKDQEFVYTLHAGTSRANDSTALVTHGGRVLNVVGRGDSLAVARQRVYERIQQISFAGKHYREDIGTRA